MAAPKAPVLGDEKADVSLDETVFGADIKPYLVHEAVRAELNAHRQGTRAAKSRGLVSGGRSKPWRQKGTGRARQGTTRAPQFTGGGHTFALFDGASFDTPSTKAAVQLLGGWGQATPTVVVVHEDEAGAAKSFRNLDRVLVTVPSELEVAQVVWARSLAVSQAALEAVQGRATQS